MKNALTKLALLVSIGFAPLTLSAANRGGATFTVNNAGRMHFQLQHLPKTGN